MDQSSPTLAIVLLLALLVGPVAASGQGDTVYFVVARPELYRLGFGDSYILPISNPTDIAVARNIVNESGFALVFARIVAGADGINRNWLAPGQPEWSWHVAAFDGFATAAIELCDGTPTFTEVDAHNWGPGDEVQICYWTYTVVEEIVPLVSTEHSTWGRIKSLYTTRR